MFSNYIIFMLYYSFIHKLCYFYTEIIFTQEMLNINLTQNIQIT